MNQFKWTKEEEDAKYHQPDEVDKARIHQIKEIRRVMTHKVEGTNLKGKGSPKEAANLKKKFTMTAEHGSELNVSEDGGYQDERPDRPTSSQQQRPDVDFSRSGDGDPDQEDKMHHKRINRLNALELAVLDKIREINVKKVIEAHPKDVEVIRNKVIGELCDEDRNFARYYMSQIVKDMRTLHCRRGLPDKSELPQGDDGNSLIDSEDELEQ